MAIQGLDLSTPDDIVKDGACSELYNMRYKDGAWRPVHPYTKTLSLLADDAAEMEIVYHHPAAGENVYIARYKDDHNDYATITFQDEALPSIEYFASVKEVVGISHFGNVLIFDVGSSVVYYLLKDSKYTKITFPPYARLSISNINALSPEPTRFWADYGYHIEEHPYSITKAAAVVADGATIFQYTTDITNLTTGDNLLPLNGESSWRGEILLFSTWQLEDGTNVAPSPLLLVHSSLTPDVRSYESLSVGVGVDEDKEEKVLRLNNILKDYKQTFTYKTNLLSSIRPTIDIRIPKDWDYSAVRGLVIWATRINSTFEVQIPTDPIEYEAVLGRYWFADNELARQPFYKVTELSVNLFTDDPSFSIPNNPDIPEHDPDDGYVDDEYDPSEGWDPDYGWDDRDDGYDDMGAYALSEGRDSGGYLLYTLTLSRAALEKATSNERYVPNNNAHLLFSTHPYDSNNRYHFYNYKQVFAKGYHISDSNNALDTSTARYFDEWLELDIDGKRYNVISKSLKQGLSMLEGTPMYNIISYPDIRATRYSVAEHFRVSLKQVPENSFAWYHEAPTQYAKFPPISLDTRVLTGDELPKDNSAVVFNNRVQVTSPNNLFSMPFELNYAVGSRENTILALQSAAIKIGDEQVGALPLYVFSTEGIFALRAGVSTLYAAVNPINYDKIINPSTLAINGAIIYITEKGVHLLTNAGSTVISSPIHGIDGTPPLDFLRNCTLLHPKQYNEVILYKEGSAAYIYNLDNDYWSTRVLDGVKINTDELVTSSGIIYDISKEDVTQNLDCNIATRPIKLGNVEFKRLETIIPRVQDDKKAPYRMRITGSVDKVNTVILRDGTSSATSGPLVFRRTPFSAKYFNVMVTRPAQTGTFAITHIDFEWYSRFGHRMR